MSDQDGISHNISPYKINKEKYHQGLHFAAMQLGTHLKSAPDTTLENFFFWGGGGVLGTLQDVFKRAQNISKHFHRYELCHLKILLYY